MHLIDSVAAAWEEALLSLDDMPKRDPDRPLARRRRLAGERVVGAQHDRLELTIRQVILRQHALCDADRMAIGRPLGGGGRGQVAQLVVRADQREAQPFVVIPPGVVVLEIGIREAVGCLSKPEDRLGEHGLHMLLLATNTAHLRDATQCYYEESSKSSPQRHYSFTDLASSECHQSGGLLTMPAVGRTRQIVSSRSLSFICSWLTRSGIPHMRQAQAVQLSAESHRCAP